MRRTIDRLQAARREDRGFTLIELLIVIIILGVLAAIVVFSVRGITDTGEESACEANYQTALTAVEAHYADQGDYPATLGDLVTGNGGTPVLLAEDPSASGDAAIDVTYAQTGGGTGYTLDEGTACD